eukprot:5818221-Amphidinium_carterae.1
MNAAWARETDATWSRQQVSEAWTEFKQRCPDGFPEPGVTQPCHRLPPGNLAGVRMGRGHYCLEMDGDNGKAVELDVTVSGTMLESRRDKLLQSKRK